MARVKTTNAWIKAIDTKQQKSPKVPTCYNCSSYTIVLFWCPCRFDDIMSYYNEFDSTLNNWNTTADKNISEDIDV